LKTLNESFTDQEFEALKQAKDSLPHISKKTNWHDLIYDAILFYVERFGEDEGSDTPLSLKSITPEMLKDAQFEVKTE
jgi:hypothetical protein